MSGRVKERGREMRESEGKRDIKRKVNTFAESITQALTKIEKIKKVSKLFKLVKDQKELFLINYCRTLETLGKLIRLKIQINVMQFIHCGWKDNLMIKCQHHRTQHKHPLHLAPLHPTPSISQSSRCISRQPIFK